MAFTAGKVLLENGSIFTIKQIRIRPPLFNGNVKPQSIQYRRGWNEPKLWASNIAESRLTLKSMSVRLIVKQCL